jgi:hypothetical protein
VGTWWRRNQCWGHSTMVGSVLPLVSLPHLLDVSSLGGFIHILCHDGWSVLRLTMFVGSSCEELAMLMFLSLAPCPVCSRELLGERRHLSMVRCRSILCEKACAFFGGGGGWHGNGD